MVKDLAGRKERAAGLGTRRVHLPVDECKFSWGPASSPSWRCRSQLPARLMLGTTPWERRRSRYASRAHWLPRSEWGSHPGAGRRTRVARSKARVSGAVGIVSSAAPPTVRREQASSTPATESQPSLVATPVMSAGHPSPGRAGGSAWVGQAVGRAGARRAAVSRAGPAASLPTGTPPRAVHELRDPVAATRFTRTKQRHRQPGTVVGAPTRFEKLACPGR